MEYTHQLVGILKSVDPGHDLDAAHDAWIELQESGLIEARALVKRTRYRAIDARRREETRHRAEHNAAREPAGRISIKHGEHVDPSLNPSEIVANRESAELLNAAQTVLTGRELETVRRYFYNGDSVADIAHDWGCPTSTIYTCRRRALESLRHQALVQRLAQNSDKDA